MRRIVSGPRRRVEGGVGDGKLPGQSVLPYLTMIDFVPIIFFD